LLRLGYYKFMSRFDVIIIGAGLNGLATALALGGRACRMPLRVALVDRADPHGFALTAHDSRCSALTLATQRMLQALGAWENMAPQAQEMRSVIVTDTNTNAFAETRKQLLSFLDDGKEAPAVFLENQIIFQGLLKELDDSPGITLYPNAAIQAFHFGPGLARVELASGQSLKANLIVGADGRGSRARVAAGLKYDGWDYDQSAITLTIGHELPHEGRAEEHFNPHGVFAILPLSGNRSSLVWTEPHEKAKALVALSDAEFLTELQQRFGTQRGALQLLSHRHAYPLAMRLASSFTAPRLALIGDAAHALHPLAGLGLNMGFKDTAALSECVMEAARLGADIGAASVLEGFVRWRRFDTYATAAMMDGMNRLFANSNESLRLLRHAGLRLVDQLNPIKRALQKEAAGLTGDLPRLMRGLAA
jgi:2-octaprenyl-6-methoxyphenol hydroxylase